MEPLPLPLAEGTHGYLWFQSAFQRACAFQTPSLSQVPCYTFPSPLQHPNPSHPLLFTLNSLQLKPSLTIATYPSYKPAILTIPSCPPHYAFSGLCPLLFFPFSQITLATSKLLDKFSLLSFSVLTPTNAPGCSLS